MAYGRPIGVGLSYAIGVRQENKQRDLRYHRRAHPVWSDNPMVGIPRPAGLLSGGACYVRTVPGSVG